MLNQLVINVTLQETRVALIENGVIAELYFERARDRGILGSIFKGKVVRVLPGMQAAFVDIGLERAAFLYVSDVYEDFEEFEPFPGKIEVIKAGGSIEDVGETGYSPNNTVPPSQIQDLLREGQDLLVQISKEPLGSKGARVTTHITLPGRYLVFMPTVDHVGISRRIHNEAERHRLKEIVSNIKVPGTGFIVRTASEGASEDDLKNDMEFLLKLWDDIQRKKEQAPVPSVIHHELNLALWAVRDLFTAQVEKLIIDCPGEYEKVMEFIDTFMPQRRHLVELYQEDEPIFHYLGIKTDEALKRRIWLKSGGYIIIEQMEALTAIDVNTGRYVGKRSLEETILQTNLEAVKEIVYQLRLRNIGGIIIIDFIDMEKERHREKVFNALKETLKADKAKTNILKISSLGLVEMTRERNRESIGRTLSEPCPYCEGRGFLKSKTTLCYEIFQEIRREAPRMKSERIFVNVHPDIADLLYDEECEGIEELEKKYSKRIIIRARNDYHQEQFEVTG
ncbi:MAG: Rne/Rng family ribonuclease [Deltaproteobacteria bacterium]|nr:MAG: Rne/Rng family ribonuclease [Deltaproteobacteria bacterium]